MNEEKDLSIDNQDNIDSNNDAPVDEQNIGNNNIDSVENDSSKAGNGYNGLASSNRHAYARGLNESYDDRIARNQANLNASRARANDSYKMKNGHEGEERQTDEVTGESNFKKKNKLDTVKDKGDVLRDKAELASSKIDKARANAFKVMHPGEAAKMALSAKLKTMLLPALLPICFGLMFVFVLFVSTFLVLGLFEIKSNASDNVAISAIYSECNGITVGGKLYSLDDYVAGVVEHEAYLEEGEEALKAQAIAARTYALVKTNGCTKAIENSQGSQTFDKNPTATAKKASNDTAGLVLTYNGEVFLSEYDSFCYADGDCSDARKNGVGSYTVIYKKLPNKEMHKITLSDASQYWKIVPGAGHARGMSQLVSYQLAKQGKKYDEILKYFYSDGVQISSLTSNDNSGGVTSNESSKHYNGTYTDNYKGKKYYNYKQATYGGWIKSSGCGLTSAAIIINSTNRNVTPKYLYDNYRLKSDGVYINQYFTNYSYKTSRLDKSVSSQKSQIISHINSGGEAIFKVTSKCKINGISWTGWQHYFAVLDYDSKNNKIYVSNPGTVDERRNGWISLDSFDCATVAYLVKYAE